MTDDKRLQDAVVCGRAAVCTSIVSLDARYGPTGGSCLDRGTDAFPFAIRYSPFAPQTAETA
jgi:hypothetical protein